MKYISTITNTHHQGYIYLRSHASYENAYKVGVTKCLVAKNRECAAYETGEGYFETAFQVTLIKEINLETLEKLIYNKFSNLLIEHISETRIYDKKIKTNILPYLHQLGIKYNIFSKRDIIDSIHISNVLNDNTKTNVEKNEYLLHYVQQRLDEAHIPFNINLDDNKYTINDRRLSSRLCKWFSSIFTTTTTRTQPEDPQLSNIVTETPTNTV